MAAMKDESAICSETASCINIRNLIKFGMEEVRKNEMKSAALRHGIR
jgi:hypothetical protein